MTTISPLSHPTHNWSLTIVQYRGCLYPGTDMVWVRFPLTSRTDTVREEPSHNRKLKWWSVVRPNTDFSPWGRASSSPGVWTLWWYITRLRWLLLLPGIYYMTVTITSSCSCMYVPVYIPRVANRGNSHKAKGHKVTRPAGRKVCRGD